MPYAKWNKQISFSGEPNLLAILDQSSITNVQIIPLDNSPNQNFDVSLYIDGKNRTFKFRISYNEMACYWTMRISDTATKLCVIDSIPLVTGQLPYVNLLGQYAYLGIGSAYIYPVEKVSVDYPDNTDLGSEFLLLWGDTPKS